MEESADNTTAVAVACGSRRWPSRWRELLPWLLLLLVAAAFLHSLGFGFVNWDDDLHVTGNPAVTGTGGARDRWLTPGLGYAIPVTVATYRVEYLLVGESPWLYHATNLLLHLGVCGLVYLLGRRFGLGKASASIGMLFFGLHPVVAEPVCWISGRKDLLAAALGLLATWWALCASRPKSSLVRTILASGLFALAVLSKPSVLALPVFWALVRLQDRRVAMARSTPARRFVPALAIAVAAGCLSWIGQRHVGAVAALPSVLTWMRQVLYALGYHLGLAVFVQQPLAKHIPPQMPPPFEAAVDLLPVAVVLLGWLWLRRRKDTNAGVARIGLLFALLAYVPSSGIVPLNRYLADSYVYLPLVGLAWLAGACAEGIAARVRTTWAWLLATAAAAALSFGAFTASAAWHDSVALWKTVYDRYPDSPQVCLNFGNAFFEQGNPQAALELYDRCSRRFGPDHFAKNRAIALFAVGRHAEAEPILRRLAVQFPGDLVVQKYLRYLAGEAR